MRQLPLSMWTEGISSDDYHDSHGDVAKQCNECGEQLPIGDDSELCAECEALEIESGREPSDAELRRLRAEELDDHLAERACDGDYSDGYYW